MPINKAQNGIFRFSVASKVRKIIALKLQKKWFCVIFKNQYLNYNLIKGIDLYNDLGMTGALLDDGICNLVQIIFSEIFAFKVPKKVSRILVILVRNALTRYLRQITKFLMKST